MAYMAGQIDQNKRILSRAKSRLCQCSISLDDLTYADEVKIIDDLWLEFKPLADRCELRNWLTIAVKELKGQPIAYIDWGSHKN